MEVKEIKVGELNSFINSREFKLLNPPPITELRAISQYNNPHARFDDAALIYFQENHKILGFAGILPARLNIETTSLVYSNTCWWVHPQKGKAFAIPLLYKVLEKCDFRLYLSDTTPRIKSILEKTNKFEFLEPVKGIRGFLRFYLADIFSNRFIRLAKFSFFIAWIDIILNLLTAPLRLYFQNFFEKGRLEIQPVSTIDKILEEFIRQYGASDFIQKTPESFEWFQKYPWMQVSENESPYQYPFTYIVKNFSLEYFVLKKEGSIKGFVAISKRENLAKVPFFYFDKKYTDEVVKSVLSIILKKKFDSMVVFHPDIVNYIETHKMPFLFRKKQIKFVGATKSIYKYFTQNPYIQDGDGDVVFT